MSKMQAKLQKSNTVEKVTCAHKNYDFLPDHFLKAICNECGQILKVTIREK